MNDILQELLDDQVELVQKYFIEKDDPAIPPYFVYIDADKKVTQMVVPFRNADEKELMINAVRRLIQASDAEAYVMVSESWMVTLQGDPREPKNLVSNIKASEHSDRVECMSFYAESKTRSCSLSFPILREKGRVWLGEPFEMGAAVGGDITGFIKEIIH